MPMVLKLQADAINEDVSVASLLRTAKALATKLDLEDALIWIDRELNGYEQLATEDLPAYRRCTGEPKAWNPYHGWQPIHFEDAETMKLCSSAPIGQSLGAIEEMLRNRPDTGHLAVRKAMKPRGVASARPMRSSAASSAINFGPNGTSRLLPVSR